MPEVWEDVIVEDLDVEENRDIAGLPIFIVPEHGIGCPHDISEVPRGSALAIFRYFFVDIMLETFVTATNAYVEVHLIRGWKKLDLPEFKAFLGIVIHLGIIHYPSRKHIWSTGPSGSVFIRKIMSKDRFEQILKCWHYRDYSRYTEAEILEGKASDPFWPVAEFCDLLANQFNYFWAPAQGVDIDEQCIPWKGRHKCRCYNPSKPEKWHFKIFSLNDSRSGYQLNFYPYRGKAEVRPDGVSATAFPAHILLHNEKYHHRNYILYTDNWFTSFGQLRILRKRGILFVGTIKSIRSGVPKKTQGRPRKWLRGEFCTRKALFNGSTVYYTEWQDKKPVKILHTFNTYKDTCTRQVRENGRWSRKQYTRPTIINLYNKGMGVQIQAIKECLTTARG